MTVFQPIEEAPKDDGEVSLQDGFGLLRSFIRHVSFVKLALRSVVQEIENRATVHDVSKLLDDEFAGFSRINKAARVHKFGSPEYSVNMDKERSVIDLHFSRNRHHAEYFITHPGELGMNFLDIIEMVCDWWGASNGYDSPMPWMESVELNLKNKGKYLSDHQIWLVRSVAEFLSEASK